ncbi:hypothetical protein [Microcystis viridis]|uniref:hypothetical protein n=1 Tax=Microcystis viridis TaxID=44822 RepID=UPI0013DE0491|nr:hypothetical protein [Microcystis viridis]
MKPLYIKTLLRFLPIVFDLERANQLSLLPDKDLVDLCHPIKPYQVTKNLTDLILRMKYALVCARLLTRRILTPENENFILHH